MSKEECHTGAEESAPILESVGKQVSRGGGFLNWLAGILGDAEEAVDARAQESEADPVSGVGLGVVGGTLDHLKGTARETGQTLDKVGRSLQGDKEATQDLKERALDLGRTLAYAQGKVCEKLGGALERLGDESGNPLARAAGELATSLGTLGREMATEENKLIVDSVADAGVHLTGRMAQRKAQALRWLGDATGDPEFAALGETLQEQGGTLRQRTQDSPLVAYMSRSFEERRKLYKTSSGYVVSKDATRAALRVSDLLSGAGSSEIWQSAAEAAVSTSSWLRDVKQVVCHEDPSADPPPVPLDSGSGQEPPT